jgi:MFS family permease
VKAPIAHATLVAALGVLPTFLTGGLVTQLRDDLAVDVAQIGLATASLFVTTSFFAPTGARIARRIGTSRAIVVAPIISGVSLAIGAAAMNFAWLVAAMIVGGMANAIAQPVASIRLAEFVHSRSLGLAFGIKQAAVPSAALFAGLAVPTIAVTVGWRWVWFTAAMLAVLAAVYGYASRRVAPVAYAADDEVPRGRDRLERRTMFLVTFGAFLAATVGTSVGVFFVDSAVSIGFTPTSAGLMYAGFSAIAILTRVLLGWYSDRKPGIDSYLLATCLLAVGVLGNLLFASQAGWAVFGGALLSYVLGWAWPGLLQWSVVRDNRSTVATATGFFQSGSSLGAGVGPIFFGALVGATTYQLGWLVAAGIGLFATLFLALGTRAARKERIAVTVPLG